MHQNVGAVCGGHAFTVYYHIPRLNNTTYFQSSFSLSLLFPILLIIFTHAAVVMTGCSVSRHESNALAMYKTVKKLGVPDSRIILMMSEGFACNPRNIYPGRKDRDRETETAREGEGERQRGGEGEGERKRLGNIAWILSTLQYSVNAHTLSDARVCVCVYFVFKKLMCTQPP